MTDVTVSMFLQVFFATASQTRLPTYYLSQEDKDVGSYTFARGLSNMTDCLMINHSKSATQTFGILNT